jgi:hypothetical protein
MHKIKYHIMIEVTILFASISIYPRNAVALLLA